MQTYETVKHSVPVGCDIRHTASNRAVTELAGNLLSMIVETAFTGWLLWCRFFSLPFSAKAELVLYLLLRPCYTAELNNLHTLDTPVTRVKYFFIDFNKNTNLPKEQPGCAKTLFEH